MNLGFFPHMIIWFLLGRIIDHLPCVVLIRWWIITLVEIIKDKVYPILNNLATAQDWELKKPLLSGINTLGISSKHHSETQWII